DQYFFYNTQTGSPQNLATTGDSLASMELGLPGTIYFAAQDFNFRFPSWAPFIEDKWQITPKLNLSLGLRYDYYSTPDLVKSMTSELDPANGDWLIGGGTLPPACDVTNAAPCIPGNGMLANISDGNKIVEAKNPNIGPNPVDDDFAPRIGVAWRPTERTVVRAGYGISYDTLAGLIQTFQANVGAWPDATNTQLAFNALGSPLTTVQNLQSLSASPLPTATPWTVENWMYDPNIKPARSQQWNVEIQRQMTKNLMLSLGYVGSNTDRLNVSGLFNVSPTAGLGAAGQPFPWASPTWMGESIGLANYNSLQFEAKKQFSSGLQFLISYTYSKAMDNGGSGFFEAENGPGGSSVVENFYNLKDNWGLSAYDVTNYLSAAIQYQLPFGNGHRLASSGMLSHLLGGWQFNSITSLRSGEPYNLDVLGDAADINDTLGVNYDRPNLVGDPNVANPTAAKYFNPKAFSIPVDAFGNFGQDELRSAAVYDEDFSLFKEIPIKESVSLELRADAFNIFNIQNLDPPGVDIGTVDAGVVNGVAIEPRQFQLAMKLTF
ncbi:MAG: TonB-dependent receptor domain-containing protein, partial [Terriglobia bacterium]